MTPLEVAVTWADMTLFITKNTFANTPTYASRSLGYIGLTMYETVVHSDSSYSSLSNKLNGLGRLPLPQKEKKYNWVLCMNAGQAYILKNIYLQTLDENKSKIDSLEEVILQRFEDEETDVKQRSISYGQAVAKSIYEWSKNDGGHRGYLHNFDPKFVAENKPGAWEPALFSQTVGHLPLHPYWGRNRPFVARNMEIATPSFILHSPVSSSPCYEQFINVYKKGNTLTQEEKEIAMWWNDDPGETITPPGHSYNLATLVIKSVKPDLVKCAQTYASVGMAVADAFICCWKWKYTFYSERPTSYVNDLIDPEWNSFWPNPPFPAFPSGHAVQSSAAATVLTELYGEHFSFVDDTHANRPADTVRNVEYKPRHFTSFWEVAEETAMSRFYGGIHTRQDNEMGLQKGKEIGTNVIELTWLD
jgi:hypothetical protein